MVEPAFVCLPDWHRTLGPEVGRLCTVAGYAPDAEQQLALDATFALTAAGRSAASTVVLLACRQNLKTGGIKQIELGWLFVTGERLVVHSAHEFDTSRETYRDMKEIIDGTPILRKRIAYMHDTPADMSIETVTGSRLVFKTRTKGAGVGKSPRKIVLDEGYALIPEHMSALRFSISAQPDPQVIVGSSAAHEESDVLRTFVERGRAGGEARLAYLEWCIREGVSACRDGANCSHVYGKAVGCVLDDLDALRAANPQLGKRLQVQTILDERVECVTVDLAAKFFRERGGLHDEAVAEGHDSVLTPMREAWPDRADTGSRISSRVAFGLDVTPDAGTTSIAAYGLRSDDVGHGELIEHRPGTRWVVDRLVELVDEHEPVCLVVDPSGPAGRFLKRLRAFRREDGEPVFVELDEDEVPDEGQVRLVLMGGREYAQACGALADDVVNDAFRHIGQTQLADALTGARTRPLADAWAWSRKNSSVDISPLVAVTLARDGFAAYGEGSEVDAWVLSG
jgi:hypothetical protein